MAVLCAALTVGFLARSVTLLPHDRTRDQRQCEHDPDALLSTWSAWIPPMLAVLACGLQRTFWENAIINTGEAIDLLIFSYVILCLLEYRLDQRDSRLYRLAFAYGLGATNNFALAGFFPAMLVALIWIKGRSFFNLGFCVRMALLGLAGFAFIFLAPLLVLSQPQVELTYWDVVRVHLGFQKTTLLGFPRFLLLLVGLTSLVPILFMGIKWPASFGDISSVGNALTNLMTHVIHGLFLVACIYVVFDPPFSPRKLLPPTMYPMLSLYYLGALSIGYFSGYFLLIFGHQPLRAWQRPTLLRLLLSRGIVGLVCAGTLGVPLGLIYRNWPHIQSATSHYLGDFGTTAARQLKEAAPQGAVVMSDDGFRLYATYDALTREGIGDRYVMLESAALSYPSYHKFLEHKYPKVWPQLGTNLNSVKILDSYTLIQLMTHLSQSNSLFYLHPSFGYYFEKFYLQPRGLIYQLLPYATNEVTSPAWSKAAVEHTSQFWKKFQSEELSSLSGKAKFFNQRNDPDESTVLAGAMYSRAINFCGVEMQKAGHLDLAANFFNSSLALSPDNPVALVNLEFNKQLRSGNREIKNISEKANKKFIDFQMNLAYMMNLYGPFDEPTTCYRLAEIFAGGKNYRQAAQNLLRVLDFDAQNVASKVGLLSMYNHIRRFDEALKLIVDIRAQALRTNFMTMGLEMDLVQAEASAHLGRGETATAEQILLNAQKKYPTNSEPYAMRAELYVSRNQLTNAWQVFEEEMKAQPQEPGPLVNFARVKILNNQFNEAITYLDNALKMEPRNPYALLNRAIAYLKTGKLQAAEADYRDLESFLPKMTYPVAYGLHEIAWQKKDRPQALKYGKLFLRLAPVTSSEIRLIQERLKRLDKGSF